jgi:hypothetical protein
MGIDEMKLLNDFNHLKEFASMQMFGMVVAYIKVK